MSELDTPTSEVDSPFKVKRSPFRIFRSVLFALILREMQTRFGARRMGFIWVVFEPLAILVIVLAFHGIMHTIPMQGMDFVMYMVNGIVPFHLLRSIAWRLTDSISANQGLFGYRQVSPFDTLIARVIVELCIYACAYLIICFFIGFWLERDVTIADPFQWILALANGVLLSFSLGLAFSIISHGSPNSARVCKMTFVPLYITAGVFFPVWNLPENKLFLVAWNPYVEVINNIRAATFDNYPVVSGLDTAYPTYLSLVVLFFSMGVYRLRRQTLRAPKV